MIFKPCLVRAEWGSIEAMSGADQEEEAAGEELSGRNSRSDLIYLFFFLKAVSF